MVAEELEGVAPFDQALALVDQALELDRLDLGAVLLGLGAALGLLVAVKLGLDAVDLALEEVDERPQEVGEIVFEPRPGQYRLERIDRGFDLAAGGVGLWERPRIRLVLARATAPAEPIPSSFHITAENCCTRFIRSGSGLRTNLAPFADHAIAGTLQCHYGKEVVVITSPLETAGHR